MRPRPELWVMSERAPLAVGRAVCGRLGYDVQDDDVPVAHPDGTATPLAGSPAPVEVTVLDDADAHAAASVVARAAARDRVALLVGRDGDVAAALHAALASPPLVRAETATGERAFHTGSDRVHLAEGGLALHVVRERPHARPTFDWHEEPAGDPDAGTERAGNDRRRLVLTADGDRVTSLDGVETLACPGPERERFTHFYRREDDRLFHVYGADGEPAGVFSTVQAMRGRGFHPVPAPVVPGHLFDDAERPPRRSWAVLDPETERVTADDGPVAPK